MRTDIKALTKAYMNAGDSVGIYAVIDGCNQPMEAINYVGVKTNALGSALSYGIAQNKGKVEFAGKNLSLCFYRKGAF
jgi:hypothetical protein